MSLFYYLVEVETERDSGLIASRDEQDEIIIEALQDAEDAISISGIGAQSNSEYSVVSFSVEAMDKKELKAFNAEYEQKVLAEIPAEKELLETIRDLKTQLSAAEARATTAEGKLARHTEEAKQGETRIFQTDGGLDGLKTFFKDGKYDNVYFQRSENWSDRWDVRFEQDGSLTVRTDTAVGDMVMASRSSNEIQIRMIERKR